MIQHTREASHTEENYFEMTGHRNTTFSSFSNKYFSVIEQCFSLTTFQYKHQHKLNFSISKLGENRTTGFLHTYPSSLSCDVRLEAAGHGHGGLRGQRRRTTRNVGSRDGGKIVGGSGTHVCGLKQACAASSRYAARLMRRGRVLPSRPRRNLRGPKPDRRVLGRQVGGSSNYRAAAAARDAVLHHGRERGRKLMHLRVPTAPTM